MDRREAFERIAADASRGELSFPTSAGAALQIRRILDDPDCHIDEAARLIRAEPLLSARVVAMANSVAFNRSGKEIADVRSAVARLGFRTVRSVTTALAARQLAGTSAEPGRQALSEQLWQHTAHVAALAYVLARRATHQDADSAMFAGIVHEIGSFYLLSRLDDYPNLLDGEQEEWVGACESQVGTAVLRALAVPDSIIRAIESVWQGYLAFPPTTLGDTLLLADELAPVDSPFHRYGGADRESAAGTIDGVVGEDTLSGILLQSAEEVRSLTGALSF